MATSIIKFLDSTGKEFATEAEANAADARRANQVEVETFVAANFPAKDGAKRANPHASTALKAIYSWIGRPVVTLEA